MTCHTLRVGLVVLLLAVVAARPAQAAPIVAGSTVLHSKAIQDITLLPGTPFNPTASPIVIDDLFGIGPLTIFRDAQVGNTITFSMLDGRFFGSHPALGDYVFGRVDPLTPSTYSGVITNVVQNPADPGFATGQPSSFRSGDITWGGDSFGFEFLTGPAAGIRLYTDPSVPFSFSSTYDGLPPSPGTVNANSGPDFLNVTFNGQVVATTSDRHVDSIVPEPSSIALMVLGAVGMLGYGWQRKQAMQQCAREHAASSFSGTLHSRIETCFGPTRRFVRATRSWPFDIIRETSDSLPANQPRTGSRSGSRGRARAAASEFHEDRNYSESIPFGDKRTLPAGGSVSAHVGSGRVQWCGVGWTTDQRKKFALL